MSTIVVVARTIAAGKALAERSFPDQLQDIVIVTPLSPYKARGEVARRIEVDADMFGHRALPMLMREVEPCLATVANS